MDVLSDMLDTLHLYSRIEFRAEFTAPWGVEARAQEGCAIFYIVSRGSCYLELEGNPAPVSLVGGDIVLLPCCTPHRLLDNQKSEVVPLEHLLRSYHGDCQERSSLAGNGAGLKPRSARLDASNDGTLQYGGGGALTYVVAGSFRFESRLANPLLSSMGPMVHLRSEVGERGLWLEMILKLICTETTAARPGSQIAVARLIDLLFIQLVRTSMTTLSAGGPAFDCHGNFLRAMFDPQLGKALELIHMRPDHPWTVAELAAETGMSRTAFAVRFSHMAGMPPLSYTTKWRMLKASDMLRRGDCTLTEIAARVGYESEAAFSKAFKRETGAAPGAYRQRWRAI